MGRGTPTGPRTYHGPVEGVAEDPVVGVLEEVWASIVVAGQGISEGQWALLTDCPGWTVRDQISHLIGIERVLLGDPSPAGLADEAVPAHVKNPLGRINEAWVDARRATPGSEVLDEFEVVTARRLEALRAMPAERFDVVGWSPVGEVPYREFMAVRAFDSWVHEQDIRRALDRPGGRGGAGEAVTLQRIASAMGYVVGRNVAPPDGTAVVWRLTGPLERQVAVVMEGARTDAG